MAGPARIGLCAERGWNARHRLVGHRRQIPHPGANARLGDAQIEPSLALIHDFRHASRADALTELLRVPAKA
ncbi:MAG TPA: hypothetical protein VGR45_03460 [Stellaceae bacterium]|nr:hypothetical protein [Stellaceae bacterium]